MRTILSIFLVILVNSPAFAATKHAKTNGRACESLMRAASKGIQKVLGYSPEVISRIKKYRPQLYREIMDAAGGDDQGKIDRYTAINAYRGINVLPEDYDAGFSRNKFFTQNGETWFSYDSSIAWNYTDLDDDTGFKRYDELLEDGHRYWGVMIAVELPKYMADESYHERFRDFSILREDLGNESVFITDVSVRLIAKSGETIEKIMSYKAFKNKFGSKNKALL